MSVHGVRRFVGLMVMFVSCSGSSGQTSQTGGPAVSATAFVAASTTRTSSTVSAAPAASGMPLAGFGSTRLGAAGCNPASPLMFPEVRGTAKGAELWGLLFEPLSAGKDIKIVWRMSGTGDLGVAATGPHGQVVQPAWGPEYHGSSNWDRPGMEWGTGFVFDEKGCWNLHLSRTDTSGDVWLLIGP